MTGSGWTWKVVLALIGAGLGAYVQELIGGAFGAMAMGAIVAACVLPLFRTLFAWRRQRDEARRKPAP